MKEKKYDVFISCKSEDYDKAKEVYYFLTNNGYKAFFAPITLPEIGNSFYDPEIDDALDKSPILIVFASKVEYFNSVFFFNEWNSFKTEIRTGRKKDGNIFTIIADDIIIDDIPYALRGGQSFTISKYKDTLCEWITKPIYKIELTKIKELNNLNTDFIQRFIRLCIIDVLESDISINKIPCTLYTTKDEDEAIRGKEQLQDRIGDCAILEIEKEKL